MTDVFLHKKDIVKDWITRYSGIQIGSFGKFILLTNFQKYVDEFAKINNVNVDGLEKNMPSATHEDITIINNNTRIEKIKNFFVNNKKSLIITLTALILLILSYFIYKEINERNKIKLADKFNIVSLNFATGNKIDVESEMIKIIESKDKTYSPLALYFLIDNNIISSKEKINKLFDNIINNVKLDKEIKNLLIYKKGLYNSDFVNENDLLQILNPIINSESIWKSHALHLLAEYFFSKNEKQKSKEFFEKIIILENSNSKIKLEAQKRIQRDFSE